MGEDLNGLVLPRSSNRRTSSREVKFLDLTRTLFQGSLAHSTVGGEYEARHTTPKKVHLTLLKGRALN